jgi:hypothetical protein
MTRIRRHENSNGVSLKDFSAIDIIDNVKCARNKLLFNVIYNFPHEIPKDL